MAAITMDSVAEFVMTMIKADNVMNRPAQRRMGSLLSVFFVKTIPDTDPAIAETANVELNTFALIAVKSAIGKIVKITIYSNNKPEYVNGYI